MGVVLRPIERAKVHPSIVTAAMVAFVTDPGHSDLDNEQPISVRIGEDRFVSVTLGEVREAKLQAYALRNAQAALREIAGLVAAAPFKDGSHVVSGVDITAWTLRHAAALRSALSAASREVGEAAA